VAWLLGVNLGPTLLVTASLSGLLWRETMRREGVEVSAGDYFRTGLKVGLPALVAATAVLAWTA
jgi:arsenical pump membrane protein